MHANHLHCSYVTKYLAIAAYMPLNIHLTRGELCTVLLAIAATL